MKKILFLGALQSGGAEHQMVIIARLLKEEGYDVTYLSGSKGDFFRKELDDAGIPIIWLKDNNILSLLRLNTPYITMQVGKILKVGKYETVISFLSFWNYMNCKFAKTNGTRHRAITGIRNNRDEVFLNKKNKYYTKYECFSSYKVSNSDAAKEKFAKYYPHLVNKLITIYNIVDLPQITSSYQCKKEDRVHIIVPASYRPVKNPMGLLKGISLLDAQTCQHLQIDWYGSIKDGRACYDEMCQFITNHHLESIIHLHDATTDMANRIYEADVVGLFSTSEGLPNAICEGMMLGKPVIMSRVSDFELLAGSGNGVLCDADDPQTISEALMQVSSLTDKQIETMGSKSKEIANNQFSKERVLQKWISIL